MKTLNEIWAEHNRSFEAELKRCFQDGAMQPQARLYDAMSYSLTAGGKRLRPFLVSLFCEACGADPDAALPAKLAIEMVHTYSLIHDDLPAMDNDDYRRGRLTNHKVYGEAMAILAGDGLLTDAFRVLTDGRLADHQALACVRVLSRNSGSYGMVGGQVLDMEAESRSCTEEEVLAIQSRKTGCLIRAACEMGVICGNGGEAQLKAAGRYADMLGLAFQIRDDVLDVIGTQAELGKPVGTDAEKNTFVRLYGVDRCQELVLEYTESAIAALTAFPCSDRLAELAWSLCDRKK